jgi:hypothetical protein
MIYGTNKHKIRKGKSISMKRIKSPTINRAVLPFPIIVLMMEAASASETSANFHQTPVQQYRR